MEKLETRWTEIGAVKCPETHTSPATLGLTNMAGRFVITGLVA